MMARLEYSKSASPSTAKGYGTMPEVLQQVSLSDGSVAHVDKRTSRILDALQALEHEVAAGLVGGIFLCRVTKDSYEPAPLMVESLLGFFEPSGLTRLSAEMFKEGKRAQGVASLWEGNAPAANRSFRGQ